MLLGATLASPLNSSLAAQDHGQGPVADGPIRIDGLNFGTHWFGPEVALDDLRGKIVLVEKWGS